MANILKGERPLMEATLAECGDPSIVLSPDYLTDFAGKHTPDMYDGSVHCTEVLFLERMGKFWTIYQRRKALALPHNIKDPT